MSELVEYTEPVWRGLSLRALNVDEAYIILKSFYTKVTYLYSLSNECYKCPYSKVKALQANLSGPKLDTIKFNVAQSLKFKILDRDVGIYAFDNETSLCELGQNDMQEFGVYNLTLQANSTCAFVTDKEGVNVNLSILSAFVLVALILSTIKLTYCAWRSFLYDEEATELATATASAATLTNEAAVVQKKERMNSLDAFRGMAIVLMIFVNSGGGHYWWMEHAPWNGLHVADVVFPSFLWIMGVCIPMSVKSQLSRGATKLKISLRIIWRSLKLFAIGLCLNSITGPPLENLRIMGVLQRFGIAFLCCGILHTVFRKREEPLLPQVNWKRAIYEVIILKGELLVMLGLIIVHLGISFGLNVPDCPRGYLGPGGKHDLAAHPNCIGGAAGYVDLQILGNAHIYQHPTAKYIYDSQAFDPEGVFGCLLTTVQVLLGLLAGVIILLNTQWRERVTKWLGCSILLGLIAGILCTFSKEDGLIPINKNLWSLSFVCVTSALSFLILSLLYYLIDVAHWWSGFPFVASGKNAIILYVGHTVMHKMLPWHWRIGVMNTHFILLLESIWNTSLWVAIALYLDCKSFYYSL